MAASQSINRPLSGAADCQPLRVVSFWDGRPGHEKQTRGVLTALAALTAVEEASHVVPPFKVLDRIRLWASFFTLPARRVSPEGGDRPVDLIIGTGSSVHIPMLNLKKKYPRAKVVTCMTPEFVLMPRMDLCFVPSHDRPKARENIFETVGPPNSVSFSKRHEPGKGLVLIGGLDPKSHYWDTEMLVSRIAALVTGGSDCRWTISSSPRTPPETLHELQALAARRPFVKFYNSLDTPGGWVEQQYQENFTVWVTADSVSMIYEALTAGCRVGILPVRWRRKSNKFQQSLDFLTSKNYVTLYDTWLETGYIAAAGIQLNEASRCARELLRRWWPNRLR